MKMVFEVGDVVRLVSKFPCGWNSQMDKFLGTIQVIKSISGDTISFVNPATNQWRFTSREIAGFENDHLNSAQMSLLSQLHSTFPEGQKFYSAMSDKKFTSKGLLYGKNEGAWFNILDKGENYVYYHGRIARLRDAKPALTFAGNAVTFDKRTEKLSIGCKTVYMDDLETLNELCSEYNITAITIDGSRTVTPSDIRTWIDFINKQY
jgi:hypothetical protein